MTWEPLGFTLRYMDVRKDGWSLLLVPVAALGFGLVALDGGTEAKNAPEEARPAIVVDRVGRELMVTLSAEDCHRVMAPLIVEGAEYEGFSYGCFTP